MSRPSVMHTNSLVAVTVAIRGAGSMSASSPKYSAGPSL